MVLAGIIIYGASKIVTCNLVPDTVFHSLILEDMDLTMMLQFYLIQRYYYDVFDCNRLRIPESESVNGVDLPYVLVADEIFPLKPWLMKPFPGKEKPLEKEIFNYRLSQCRRIIENSFGILTAKWRVFRRPIKADPQYVEMITKAAVCLHNYLRLTHYIPDGFVDSEDDSGNVHPGDWRAIITGDTSL